MPTNPSPSIPLILAANDNGSGAVFAPAVVLIGIANLLAEVCVHRLAAANHNHPISPSKDHPA